MKVLFWSPLHGQAGTTSNIIAASLITGMEYRKKILLTQTQFDFNNLEAPIVGTNSNNTASKEYFRDVGIDSLTRYFKACKINYETVENCCISIDHTNMLLLPGTSKINRETFEYETENVVPSLLKSIEEVYGIVMADISSGQNSLSLKLMANADLTVVNLSQNMAMMEQYFKNNAPNMPKKVFYLFGNYDCRSKYNINNIRRKYHNYINVKNSGVMPYCTGYLDAQCDGKVVDFMRDNLSCKKTDENHYFIQKAKSTTNKILRMAGVNVDRNISYDSETVLKACERA